MFCSRCGTQTAKEARFCMACGQSIENAPIVASGSVVSSTKIADVNTTNNMPQTSGKAIGSLICGFFSFIVPAAIVAVILGHTSRSEIRQSGGRLRGEGLALAGLIFGYLGIVVIP